MDIPKHYLKNDTLYRSKAPGASPALASCGFMTKKLPKDNLIDFVESRYVILYVIRGKGTYTDWNGKTYDLLPGTLAQRIPGKLHSTTHVHDGKWVEAFIGFGRAFYDSLLSSQTVNPEQPVIHIGLHLSIMEQFYAVLSKIKQSKGVDDSEALFSAHQLLMDINRQIKLKSPPSPHAAILEEAKNILSADFHRHHDMKIISKRLHLSYERFRKIFREEIGISPAAYRNRRRIETACRLLADTGLSIKEIADELGYSDIHMFSKQFSKMQGVAPSEFRKQR